MKKNYLLFLSVVLCLAVHPVEAKELAFTFAIAPQQAPVEVARRWTPLLDYLGQEAGVILKFVTAQNIPTYQNNLVSGQYDFAYVNPYHYTVIHKKANYLAFAKERNGRTRSVIVVAKSSGIDNTTLLSGKTIAFPAPTAFISTWIPMAHLNSAGIEYKPQYVNSLDSAYRAVAQGMMAAGGGEERTLGALDIELRDRLVVIWRSRSLPAFPFVHHPRVPRDIVKKIVAAMEKLDTDDKYKYLLTPINMRGIEPATDSEYDEIRKMKLKNPLEAKGGRH